MKVTVQVPAIPPGLVSNLVGVLGIAGIAVSVGALAGSWWWSVLLGSLAALALAYLAQLGQQQAEEPPPAMTAPVAAAAPSRPMAAAARASA